MDARNPKSSDVACGTGGARPESSATLSVDAEGAERRSEWLRGEIRRLRSELAADHGADGARGLLRELYTLQRLDRDDELGEHPATMALLRAVRAPLNGNGNLPAARRAAAEAALIAAVADALRHENYAAADGLVAAFEDRVEGAEARRTLALHAAMADEAAGRYAEALARVEGVIAASGAEDAASLALVADALAEMLGEENRSSPVYAGTDDAGVTAGKGGSEGGLALLEPYPNPSQGAVTLPFDIEGRSEVRIAVYDVLGRQVAVLADGVFVPGRHRAELGARALPAGMYIVRLTAVGPAGEVQTLTERMTLVD